MTMKEYLAGLALHNIREAQRLVNDAEQFLQHEGLLPDGDARNEILDIEIKLQAAERRTHEIVRQFLNENQR